MFRKKDGGPPLNVTVILAHPDNQSFNHAIATSAVNQLKKNGHSVIFHDLYAEQFDAILPSVEIPTEVPLPPDIENHCDEISIADGLIVL
jgi:putative NADPH-quinone reductase